MPLPRNPMTADAARDLLRVADAHGLAQVLDVLVTHYAAEVARRGDWSTQTRAEALSVVYGLATAVGTLERSANPHVKGL